MTPAERRSARERQRRRRERQRKELAIYPVEAGGDVLNMLVRCEWLPDGDTGDPQKVSDAISRFLFYAADK